MNAPVRGERLCAGHAGKGVAASKAAARAGAEAANARRREQASTAAEARKRGLRDLLAARLEEKADVLVNRLMQVVETGTDADALRAIESMLSRVYGRPTETVKVEGPTEEPETVQQIRAMSIEERTRLLHSLDVQGRLRLPPAH